MHPKHYHRNYIFKGQDDFIIFDVVSGRSFFDPENAWHAVFFQESFKVE